MLILREFTLSDTESCSYIPENNSRYEYFLAADLNEDELDVVLRSGWRKFGWYYFRPRCDGCASCVPVRVPVNSFSPSKSQRRVIRKNMGVRARIRPLNYSDEVYDIYCEHSRDRFHKEASMPDFMFNFYQVSCPAAQSEYYLGGRLMAVGFLDVSARALSTVYFVYRSEFSVYSPGIFSVIREIEFARDMGKEYYYLGYYVAECPRMRYKNTFRPAEKYSWDEKKWLVGA